jgi:hypothetical protein
VTPATRTSDDVIADVDARHCWTDRLDDTSNLVPEDGRDRVGPVPVEEEQIAVAEPRRRWPNEDLPALWQGDGNPFDLEGCPHLVHDSSTNHRLLPRFSEQHGRCY